MLNLFEFILATIGLTFIFVHFYIFKWLRELLKWKLLYCFGCVGFWSGLIVYFLYNLEYIIPYTNIKLGELINYGFIGSFMSYSLYLILCPLIKKYD